LALAHISSFSVSLVAFIALTLLSVRKCIRPVKMSNIRMWANAECVVRLDRNMSNFTAAFDNNARFCGNFADSHLHNLAQKHPIEKREWL